MIIVLYKHMKHMKHMSFLGMVTQKGAELVMMAADFSPITALISSLFTIFIMLAILKKFDKI